ncbi:ParA family protein (plasmid) [Streptomyces sp. JL4002]|uniref:ParA family protein n=1 Tax=Streptomyces sp. JL4002 TaxID=3404781 RepID=UPI003B27D8CD
MANNKKDQHDVAVAPQSRQLKPFPVQIPEVITSLAYKGGIGKTTLAEELAYVLKAIAVDFDWSKGGLTAGWGYKEEDRIGVPLVEAFANERTPNPLRGGARKPDLIPGHTSFVEYQPGAETVANHLHRWAYELKRRLVVDTHPDGCPATNGAMAAARVVVTPVVLHTREMRALEQLLSEASDYPLLLIPYMVPRTPSQWAINELARLSQEYEVPVGPMVGHYAWIPTRRRRVAICSEPVAKKQAEFVREIKQVAEAVLSYGK